MERVIELHHDGHGLNESIHIDADAQTTGGASHLYVFTIDGVEVGRLQFQHGARGEANSTPGVTECAVVAALIDRLQGFQAGKFSCRENAIQLTKLEETMMWQKERAHARARRGVLGKEVR